MHKRSKLLSTSTDFWPITVEQLIAETVAAGFEKLCLGLPITVVVDILTISNDKVKTSELIGNRHDASQIIGAGLGRS